MANFISRKLRFNRNELAGSFGDLGTVLPLITGMIIASKLDSASVFMVFGVLQMMSGFFYGIPMSVQPLKAVATIVIAQQISAEVIYGGGLAIGFIMLILALTGIVKMLSKWIPKAVIRGIQFGLGLSLGYIAIKNYLVLNSGWAEWILILVSIALCIVFIKNKKFPAALFVVFFGVVYTFFFKDVFSVFSSIQLETHLPKINIPTVSNIIHGFLILGLPQVPLSIGNSILASEQLSKDLFPEKKISSNKIAYTYAFMNILSPFLSGLPVCHGSGGMAGHYSFGARTGGSVFLSGCMFIIIGFFFSNSFDAIVSLIPMQTLGVILLVESLVLMILIKDLFHSNFEWVLAIVVGLLAFFLPYGFLIALVMGTLLYYTNRKINFMK